MKSLLLSSDVRKYFLLYAFFFHVDLLYLTQVNEVFFWGECHKLKGFVNYFLIFFIEVKKKPFRLAHVGIDFHVA